MRREVNVTEWFECLDNPKKLVPQLIDLWIRVNILLDLVFTTMQKQAQKQTQSQAPCVSNEKEPLS